jgi:hypothetical protein
MAAAFPISFGIPNGAPVILREQGGKGRTVILARTDLPRDYDPPVFGGAVRGETTYYPGSKYPTSQILGPEEMPITFGGVLDDVMAGRPKGAAYELAKLINAMRFDCNPVTFEFGPLFRRCRWVRAEFRIDLFDKIPYSIELEVVDDGAGRGLRVLLGALGIPVTDGIGDLIDGIERSIAGLPT